MADAPTRLERDRAKLEAAAAGGLGAKASAYLSISGPGWLQSAITLGGGSLAAGLYLGVLSGYRMLWLQPIAMLLGVAMLISIGYVTLSTGRRPFRLVTEEVNPVLGWSWAIATLMANVVWCLPQFTLGAAALRQNLLPGVLGDSAEGPLGGSVGLGVAVGVLGAFALFAILSHQRGGAGMKVFDLLLKALVGSVVICFIGVVVRLTGVDGGIDWGAVGAGLVPDLSAATTPSGSYAAALESAGEAGRSFWTGLITGQQRDVLLTAAATAVGVNMTFLLPASLLDRGWDRGFRGVAACDLGLGLFIPFLVATGCVVMASAARFHGEYNEELVAAAPTEQATSEVAGAKSSAAYLAALDNRLRAEHGAEAVAAWGESEWEDRRAALSPGDRQLAAMLVKRDAFDLASALEPLMGPTFAHWVFGLGVLAMAASTIIVLMLGNGYVLAEIVGAPHRGTVSLIGSLIPLAFGAVAPFVWEQAMFWLAVPTSVFGMMLLPTAYITFFLLMNNRQVLGEAAPKGMTRVLVNLVLGLSVCFALFGAGWSVWSRTQPFLDTGVQTRWVAIGAIVLLAGAAVATAKRSTAPTEGSP